MGGKPSFRLLIFSLKRDLTFFSCMCDEYMRLFSVFGFMENGVNCHGKVMEFYYQISVGTLHIFMAGLVSVADQN